MPKSTGKRQVDEVNIEPKVKRRQAPGRTIEQRENQLVSLAYDLLEKRLLRGTATSQEVTTLIKMGSSSGQLEKSKLSNEVKHLEAKTNALESQKKIEELYGNALKAMRTYSGQEDTSDD